MPNHRYLRHTLAAEAVSASPQVAESFLQVWTPETWIWTGWTLDPELMQPRPPGPAYTNYLYHLKVSVTHVLSDPQLHPPRVAEAQEKNSICKSDIPLVERFFLACRVLFSKLSVLAHGYGRSNYIIVSNYFELVSPTILWTQPSSGVPLIL